ncbi:molybdate ABC transporter substrate-binding protein [Paenibacillus nanensis]|uniref:Molybdate ABC transporter substrate-binding protein n=1 Tax=Paenibacillus nanensis TaxID=393251 RepID=A0A3A1ULS0_9BACL|nr:molybdate ABC transporter substrate-binding protein [Paenibacillus nanensis]RIX48704.1 molybdate ABC transporter substrate-binding protein [Paenibacillus nanensis]
MRSMKASFMVLVSLCSILLLSACADTDSAAEQSANKAELTVSAAASMTEALNELKTVFEAEHPGVALFFNYGASGALQQQIEQGAPADLFLSASAKNMDALADKGLIAEGQTANLLSNELVVVIPKEEGVSVASLQDLQKESVSAIAVGIPESVPAGAYAKEALTNEQLWDKLQAKTVQAKDVKQVLQYVETGNADAGFVYKTDALSSETVQIAFAVDPAAYSPILYPVGIVKESEHPEEAMELYTFLQSAAAMDVFKKYGFSEAE